MPQPDLETPAAASADGGTDKKTASETMDDTSKSASAATAGGGGADVPLDCPPESFWLSKDAELDWIHTNALYERNESTKGISQSTTSHTSSNPNSKRFSLNLASKTSIFGLPKSKKAIKPVKKKSIPKLSTLVGKPAAPLTEPSSPKVSCMGRVRSKRRTRRSFEPVERSESEIEKVMNKSGFCSGFMSMFKSGKSRKKPVQEEIGEMKKAVEEAPKFNKSASKRVREAPGPESVEPVSEPPALGGMKRFTSGRRSTEEFPVY